MLRIGLHKQVYVIVYNLQRETLLSEVIGSLAEQLSHIVFHPTEYRVAVLRTPK